MSYYLPPERLMNAVLSSQSAGRVNDELVSCLLLLVTNVARMFRYDPDDLIGDTYIAVARNLKQLRPDANLFSYLTSLIQRVGLLHKRRDCRFQKLLNRLKTNPQNSKRKSPKKRKYIELEKTLARVADLFAKPQTAKVVETLGYSRYHCLVLTRRAIEAGLLFVVTPARYGQARILQRRA